MFLAFPGHAESAVHIAHSGATGFVGMAAIPDLLARSECHPLSSARRCAGPEYEYAFQTTELRIKVTVRDDGTWGAEEDTVLRIRGLDEPFHHTD